MVIKPMAIEFLPGKHVGLEANTIIADVIVSRNNIRIELSSTDDPTRVANRLTSGL